MKNKRGLNINIHLSNRGIYTLIVIGMLAIIAVGVYAVAGVSHTLDEINLPSCSDSQVLGWNGGNWSCVDMSDSIDLSNLGNIGINTVKARIYQERSNPSSVPTYPLDLPPCNAENEGLVAYARVWTGYNYITGWAYSGKLLYCNKYHQTAGVTRYNWMS